MGYAYYELPDGREAGYGVEAECDQDGCAERIDRGLGYLCGDEPDGHRDPDEPGCGRYFCSAHRGYEAHNCTAPACEAWDAEEEHCCHLVAAHDDEHRDRDDVTWTISSTDGRHR